MADLHTPVRMWRSRCGRLVAGIVFVLALSRGAPAAEEGVPRDLLHTVLARHTLCQEERLRPYNLGVKVTNRRAMIWGTLPSGELAERAAQCLRALPQLIEVRADIHINPAERIPHGLPQRLPPLGRPEFPGEDESPSD